MAKHRNHLPARFFVFNFCALACLMALTVVAAGIDFGGFNLAVAITIACTKMMLILLIFMNVKYSSRLAQIFAAAGFFWFLILIGFIMSDFVVPGYGTPYTVALPGM